MPIPAAEIKKMPVKEKLRLIEKLSKSIDADLIKTGRRCFVAGAPSTFRKRKIKV